MKTPNFFFSGDCNYDNSDWQSVCKGLKQTPDRRQANQDEIGDEAIKKYTDQKFWQNNDSRNTATKPNYSKLNKAKEKPPEQTRDFMSDDEDPLPSSVKRYNTARTKLESRPLKYMMQLGKENRSINENVNLMSEDDSEDFLEAYLPQGAAKKPNITYNTKALQKNVW